MKTHTYPRWSKHKHSELYFVHRHSWLYEVHSFGGVTTASGPERYGGKLERFDTVELAKAACEQNYAVAKAAEDAKDPVSQLKRILHPWLGDVFCYGLGHYPDDIFCALAEIKGHGFTRLTFQNKVANPDWILAKWRTYTEAECPRCHRKIIALVKSHRIGRMTVTGAPYVFCDCIRLNPSKLPSLSFFTDNWQTTLDALDFAVAYAEKCEAERTPIFANNH
jgi:hypothetical protein